MCSPPLRPADHQADLWNGLIKDDLQVVSTDHCPFDFETQKQLGVGDFRKVPNGIPGVEDRVDLLHDGGVLGGRISRERWVEIVSAAPARLFGLAGRKGAVAVGLDADVVVYDPTAEHTLSAKTHHMDVDYSAYEGRTVRGRSETSSSPAAGSSCATASSPATADGADSSGATAPITRASPGPPGRSRAGTPKITTVLFAVSAT